MQIGGKRAHNPTQEGLSGQLRVSLVSPRANIYQWQESVVETTSLWRPVVVDTPAWQGYAWLCPLAAR